MKIFYKSIYKTDDYFTKEWMIQMADKYMEMSSGRLVFKEIITKTWYNCTVIEMVKISSETQNTNFRDCEANGTFIYWWWEC